MKKSTFSRDFKILFSGNIGAHGISFLFATLVARLYPPERFADLGLFVSITTILSMLFTARLEFAVVTSQSDEKAETLCRTGIAFSAIGAVLVTAGMAIAFLLGHLPSWMIFAGFSAFFLSSTKFFTQLASRKGMYSVLAHNKFIVAFLTNIVQCLLFFASVGLVAGYFLGTYVSQMILARKITLEKLPFQRSTFLNNIRTSFKENLNFAKYDLPADIINFASSQTPIFLLPLYYGSTLAGLYVFVDRVFSAPASLIGASVSQIFFERATKAYAADKPALKFLTISIYNRIAGLGLCFTVIILLLGPNIFQLLFGANWVEAGRLAAALVSLVVLSLATSPLSMLFAVTGRQRELLIYNVIVAASRFLSILIPWFFTKDFYFTIIIYAAANFFLRLLMGWRSLTIIDVHLFKAKRTLAITAALVAAEVASIFIFS
ncbi:lipopolysaccharide biosynthesis protein [Variovorax terrae]|uniref:Lipopolysaccharide biosynthesis protein n=1 Tax=Variovorax terrae TaxID=2923278 RepID=A0A9X1VYG7_9BURK|nr:lipopolysaccharide biosynthesis protein [Variovorax terrae]MCJ0764327.1 lipopolysaccharide biosynthesis protein [Variovorax terrae]